MSRICDRLFVFVAGRIMKEITTLGKFFFAIAWLMDCHDCEFLDPYLAL